MSKSNLLFITTDKVLAYDIQVLFGKNMKSSDVIKELLPVKSISVEEPVEEVQTGLGTLESWLEGLQNG